MTFTIPENSLLLDGTWRAAADGQPLPVYDPAARSTFHVAARAGAADVDAAVAAGQRAFADWSRRSPSERGAILGRWAQLIYANVEDLARLEAQDVGKPLNDARRNIYIAASILEYFAGAADKLAGATLPSRSTDHVGFTLRQPLGVCALIIAWNVPAVLMMADAAPALAAGNAVVLKPSEHAPMSPLGIAALAQEAGLPDGLLNVLPGFGNEVGVPLTTHPGISHISFVGSTLTGRAIMRSAAENLTPVKLELGGKSPNVVFADADLDLAVDTIVESITENAGQNCYAGSRLLVQDTVYDEVVERVAARMREQRMGAWHEDLDLGPLINDAQYERVTGYLDVAAAEGARLVAGGPAAGADGLYTRTVASPRRTSARDAGAGCGPPRRAARAGAPCGPRPSVRGPARASRAAVVACGRGVRLPPRASGTGVPSTSASGRPCRAAGSASATGSRGWKVSRRAWSNSRASSGGTLA